MPSADDIKRSIDDMRYRVLSTQMFSDPSKRPLLYGIGLVALLLVVFFGVRLMRGGAEEAKLPPGSDYVSRAFEALREDPRFANNVTVLASGPEGKVTIKVVAVLPGPKEEAELRQKLEALSPPGPIEITRESPAAGKKQ
ncbi:MAG: hypothetical protein ACK55O_16060 [Phycisphaerales bacterium]|jgi:hypothetical protein|nr:hypothetical protein [Phycisphaeraceae bacterium]